MQLTFPSGETENKCLVMIWTKKRKEDSKGTKWQCRNYFISWSETAFPEKKSRIEWRTPCKYLMEEPCKTKSRVCLVRSKHTQEPFKTHPRAGMLEWSEWEEAWRWLRPERWMAFVSHCALWPTGRTSDFILSLMRINSWRVFSSDMIWLTITRSTESCVGNSLHRGEGGSRNI